MKVAAVILAAGRSSRFEDGHKLLAEIDGIPIIRHVCAAVAASGVDEIVLVTNEPDGAVARAAGAGRWRIADNPNASHGLSTSLRAGIENCPSDADGILVALADMPGITAAFIDGLLTVFKSAPDTIVFPQSADGVNGHPIIWPATLRADLQTVTGDTGGKTVLAAHKHLWRPVRCTDAGPFADIDTRGDLAAFIEPTGSGMD
ncbi:MAG: nucleotidyltransferase family protein [Hyphomicrobium sp.]